MFLDKPESLRDLTIFIMSSISSFNITSVVGPESKIFLFIPASAADAASADPNGIKTLLANGLIILILFLVMDEEVYQEILLLESP